MTDLAVDLPLNFSKESMDALLAKCYETGASDILIQSEDYAWAEVHGRWRSLTRRRLQDSEVKRAVEYVYGINGISLLASGKDLDPHYEVTLDRSNRVRFRVNVTAGKVGLMDMGSSITFRVIPQDPLELASLELPGGILSQLFPDYGMVLVVGTTGSGKSTLLASAIRDMLENGNDRKILTYESPIEFTYYRVGNGRNPLPCQCEIGVHLHSFAAAVRNAMRRKPGVIMLGECRDQETMDALIEASLTGHATYATLHAETPSETVSRIIHLFPYEQQEAAAHKFLGAVRLVVAQKLLHDLHGRRVAIREWLAFGPREKERLESESPTKWPSIIRQMVKTAGQDFRSDALRHLEAGRIDMETLNKALGEISEKEED